MEAENTLSEWEKDIKERELAEKRRVAPGWLDREEKILEPERKDNTNVAGTSDDSNNNHAQTSSKKNYAKGPDADNELDLAFGAIGLR